MGEILLLAVVLPTKLAWRSNRILLLKVNSVMRIVPATSAFNVEVNMQINKSIETYVAMNHEGGNAGRVSPEQQLRRTVMACMLWENNFYEDGQSVAQRIAKLVPRVSTEFAAQCARDARAKMKLRHMPLLIVREMARPLSKHRQAVAKTLCDVIQRPDEITEFLAIYWKDGKCPLSAQVKKGLAAAFRKFNEYELGKYNRDKAIKLRDVLFLCHSKPIDAQGINKTNRKTFEGELNSHEALYRKLVEGTLVTPDTWEVQLSGGADKKETFERLMAERKLGALAFLRNLRNMAQAGIANSTLEAYAAELKVDRVLPFRFIAAAQVVPQLELMLESLMFRCLGDAQTLVGRTCLLVDISGSMASSISAKSDMLRIDAAYGLAVLLREIAEEADIYSFSEKAKLVPPRHGFALRDAISNSQAHGGTYLTEALAQIDLRNYDRVIVITDEQSADGIGKLPPEVKGYVINVASYQNGVSYKNWVHIDGWSEAVIDFIRECEQQNECA